MIADLLPGHGAGVFRAGLIAMILLSLGDTLSLVAGVLWAIIFAVEGVIWLYER